MAKAKATEPAKGRYEVQVGTVIDGELRRRGDVVELSAADAADLLILGRVSRPQPGYDRRDMNPRE